MNFNFEAFAREVYSENPAVAEDPFLLPALYGGEVSDGEAITRFKALVVLEEPSKSFTRNHWTTPCATPEEAIRTHREIFFRWACMEPQCELFRIFVELSTAQHFFQHLYITDVWKDAAFKEKLKQDNPGYGRYWRSKLETEIRSVAAGMGNTDRSACPPLWIRFRADRHASSLS